MRFVEFAASRAGRIVRGLLGLALIGVGAALGGGWWLLAAFGLVPLAAAVFDVCLFAPLAHLPASGQALRARTHAHWMKRSADSCMLRREPAVRTLPHANAMMLRVLM